MTRVLRALTVLGLLAGGVLGMAGSIVAAQNIRAVCWAIDSTGLIVATAILALIYLRAGKMEVAAGFLVYAIGESIMLTGTPMSLEGSVPAFAAGTALWAAGLALVSVPREFTLVTRLAGLVALSCSERFRFASSGEIHSRPLRVLCRCLPIPRS